MKSKILWARTKNFRSHVDTLIEFGDFTVLLGESDSGKSAMLGSIRWCLFNDPSGDKFVRREYETDENGIAILGEDGEPIQKGELTCDTEVAFDTQRSVRHVKAPNDHFYELKENGEVVLTLRNFGVGPVKEVMDFHGMHRVDFFGEKQILNFCPQMDKPFFLGESGPTRATMIGKLAHTDAVDLAIKNTDSELRTARKIAKEKKIDLKKTTEELKKYKNLPKIEKDLEKIDKYLLKAEEADSKYNEINSHILRLRELKVQKAQLELLIAHELDINRVVDILESIAGLLVKANSIIKINNMRISNINQKIKLQGIASLDETKLEVVVTNCDSTIELMRKMNSIAKINEKLNKEKSNLEEISKIAKSNIDIDKIMSMLDSCKESISKYATIQAANTKFEYEKDRKSKGDKVIKDLEVSLNNKFGQYKNMLKKFNKCPTCLGEITEERIDNLQDII